MRVLDQPVDEGNELRADLGVGERGLDVDEAPNDVLHRLLLAVLVGHAACEEHLHAGRALVDVEVERLVTERVREDEVVDRRLGRIRLLQDVQVDEEERQRSQALLPIDDEVSNILVTNDDRAEEVVAVLLDVAQLVLRSPVVVELVNEVLE